MPNRAKYVAFLSYSHHDQTVAKWLHKRLETYKPPKELLSQLRRQTGQLNTRLSPIFKDRDELPSAPSLSKVINQALLDSSSLIVICSPDSAQSKWVNNEIIEFKKHHGEERILSLIVSGEPNSGDPATECFPPALLRSVDADGQYIGTPLEPVAADARAHGDGPKQASLKIAAGIIGVGFDALRQREAQRNHKRLLTIAGASTAGFLFASALAISAVLASKEAQLQRERAEASAQTAKRTSEFLVDTFQLAGPNEARGRSVTAVEILDRGVARIEKLHAEPTIQSALMHTMGEVYTGLGLYTQAAALLETANRVQNSSANIEATAATQTALAEALMHGGRLDQASKTIGKANQTLEPLPWSALKSEAQNLSGDILVKQGKTNDAESHYRTALEADMQTQAQDTISAEQLARSETGLATALIYQGRFDDAEPLLLQGLDNYIKGLGDDHPKVATAYNNLASLYYFKQQWQQVSAYYGKAEPLYRKLYGDSHPEFAAVLNNYGRIELENGDPNRAEQLLTESADIYRRSQGNQAEGMLFALNSLGLTYIALGDFSKATEVLTEASSYLTETHRLNGPILLNRALAACQQQRQAEGLSMATMALPELRAHYPATDWRFAMATVVEQSCTDPKQRDNTKLESAVEQLRQTKGVNNLFTRLAQEQLQASVELP